MAAMNAAASALVFLAALVFAGDAGAGARKSKRVQASPVPAASARARNPMAENGYNGYYERIEDRVPFGSKIWWDVYTSMPRGG
jgi:hypothetical protein